LRSTVVQAFFREAQTSGTVLEHAGSTVGDHLPRSEVAGHTSEERDYAALAVEEGNGEAGGVGEHAVSKVKGRWVRTCRAMRCT
jgi:hypothetical protein